MNIKDLRFIKPFVYLKVNKKKKKYYKGYRKSRYFFKKTRVNSGLLNNFFSFKKNFIFNNFKFSPKVSTSSRLRTCYLTHIKKWRVFHIKCFVKLTRFNVNAFLLKNFWLSKSFKLRLNKKFRLLKRRQFYFFYKNSVYKCFYRSNFYLHLRRYSEVFYRSNLRRGFFPKLIRTFSNRRHRSRIVYSNVVSLGLFDTNYLFIFKHFVFFSFLKIIFFSAKLNSVFFCVTFLVLFFKFFFPSSYLLGSCLLKKFFDVLVDLFYFFSVRIFFKFKYFVTGYWSNARVFFNNLIFNNFNSFFLNLKHKGLLKNDFNILDDEWSRFDTYYTRFKSRFFFLNRFDYLFYELLGLNSFFKFIRRRFLKMFKYVYLKKQFHKDNYGFWPSTHRYKAHLRSLGHIFFNERRTARIVSSFWRAFFIPSTFFNTFKKKVWWFNFCTQCGFSISLRAFLYKFRLSRKKIRKKRRFKKYRKLFRKFFLPISRKRRTVRKGPEWVVSGVSNSFMPVYKRSFFRPFFKLFSVHNPRNRIHLYRFFFYLYSYFYSSYKNFFLKIKLNLRKLRFIRVFYVVTRKSLYSSLNRNFLVKHLSPYKEINFKLRCVSFFSTMLNDKFNLNISLPKNYFKIAISGLFKHF